MAVYACQACGESLPPPKKHGRARKWCSERCRKSLAWRCLKCNEEQGVTQFAAGASAWVALGSTPLAWLQPAGPTTAEATLGDRFWSKVDKGGADGCWLWLAGKTGNGYGGFGVARRMRAAHRLAYEALVGPIPTGHLIHHTCSNRRCVNPAHMETHTPAEHPDAGIALNRAKTHCPQGHPYSEANTYVHGGRRICLACRQDRDRKRAASKSKQTRGIAAGGLLRS